MGSLKVAGVEKYETPNADWDQAVGKTIKYFLNKSALNEKFMGSRMTYEGMDHPEIFWDRAKLWRVGVAGTHPK